VKSRGARRRSVRRPRSHKSVSVRTEPRRCLTEPSDATGLRTRSGSAAQVHQPFLCRPNLDAKVARIGQRSMRSRLKPSRVSRLVCERFKADGSAAQRSLRPMLGAQRRTMNARSAGQKNRSRRLARGDRPFAFRTSGFASVRLRNGRNPPAPKPFCPGARASSA